MSAGIGCTSSLATSVVLIPELSVAGLALICESGSDCNDTRSFCVGVDITGTGVAGIGVTGAGATGAFATTRSVKIK